VDELSATLENLPVYNNILHEEVHMLYDQMNPHVPPEVAEMGAEVAQVGGGEGPKEGLNIFGAPPPMNIVEDRPPEAWGGFSAVNAI
jgi:hypothetical protein